MRGLDPKMCPLADNGDVLQQSQYPFNQSDWYLLYFKGCTNCSLTGTGTLSGQSALWVTST